MRFIIFKYITTIAAIFLLSGCLGGSIATQIVSTIATKMADRAIANAMDVQDGPSNRRQTNTYNNNSYKTADNLSANKNNGLVKNKDIIKNNDLIKYNETLKNNVITKNKNLAKNVDSVKNIDFTKNNLGRNNPLSNTKNSTLNATPADPYQAAMINMAFEQVKPVQETSASQPSPLQVEEIETRIAIIEGNQLVQVELFNLLIGDEKNAVFENARMLGAINLPKQREWQHWGVATGAFLQLGENAKKIITFLIPPEFGKLPSGSFAMVELASAGELNVARYKGN